MGFWGDIGNRVRGSLQWDKEKVVLNLAKGGTASSFPSTGFDLLQSYGYDVLSDYLKLEHDLMSRYVDYEEMDDYPELACLTGDSLVFTVEDGWIEIQSLAERGGEFHVLSYDKELRSLVPAKSSGAILSGGSDHSKPMVKVTLDNGATVRCTADHPFLTKDEKWIFAGDLKPGDRLMPGVTRMRQTNGTESQDYWQVHQPQSDSQIRSSDGKRWVWVHRIVAEHLLGVQAQAVVISEDREKNIGEAHQISIAREALEAAWMEGGTVAEAARILGVSCDKANRELVSQDLLSDDGNHRVVRVEPIPTEPVYDLEVPGYSNFVCNGVVVHNTAIDIYADDACIGYDTEIPLLNGTTETVGSLYERGAKDEWVYAFDVAQKRVVAGQFSHVAVIAESLPVFKVTFRDRDGNVGYIKATADHKFLMLNGKYQPTSALSPGDRLMALFKFAYRNKNRKQDYEQVLVSPFKRQWQSTHRMVLDSCGVHVPKGHVVHHKDYRGINNVPDNLGVMHLDDHTKEHSRFGADNPRFRSDVTADDLLGVIADGYKSEKVAAQDRVPNDVVISVEPAGEERIFDLVNSEPTHNFAAGHDGRYVFVKNTQIDSLQNRTLWVDAPDKTVETILTDLYEKRLRIDEEAWSMCRTLVKYGNNYEELLVAQNGVVGTNFLPPPTMRRIEGRRGELFGFVQDYRGRFGYCLASGSRVWGASGMTEIQDFGSGAVLGLKDDKPELLEVKQRHSNGVQKIVKLRTRHREVFLTKDHPVYARHGKSGPFEWTKVKDLRIEYSPRANRKPDIAYYKTAYIMVSTRMPSGEVPTWDVVWRDDPYQPSTHPSTTSFILSERPTKEFCRFFGFMLANGWVKDLSGSKNVGFARGEYENRNDFYHQLLGGFGVPASIRKDEMASNAYSLNFGLFLESCGWINGFANKRIPPWMFGLPEDYREEILRGFIDGDGHELEPGKFVNRDKFEVSGKHADRYAFYVSNYDLARDFKNLIDGLGYVAGNLCEWMPKDHESKGKWIQTDKPSYRVQFVNAKFTEPFIAEPVLSIEDAGEAEVFDLEVDDDAHNFIADGVVVHNSPDEFKQLLTQRMGSQSNRAFDKYAALEDWEVVHMRLRSKHRRAIYGFCERKTAKVSTPYGLKEIQHIRPGDRVHVLSENEIVVASVLNAVCNGQKKVYSVKTRHRENFATAEHPFMVLDSSHLFTYRQVKDLKKGDKLIIPRPCEIDGELTRAKKTNVFDRVKLTDVGIGLVSGHKRNERYLYQRIGVNDLGVKDADLFLAGSKSIGKEDYEKLCNILPCIGENGSVIFHARGRSNFVDMPRFIDESFAWLFGILIGDGWTSDGSSVGVAVSLDENVTNAIRGAFSKYGLVCKDKYQKYTDDEGKEHKVLRQLTISSSDLVDILNGLGWINGAKNKRVPQWLFQSSRSIRESFLEGYIEADGWHAQQHGYEIVNVESCNYDLVRDIKSLVDGLGWTSGNVRVRAARTVVSKHPAMLGKEVNSGPGYMISYRKSKLFDGPFLIESVISVTEQETDAEDVYDIEIDHPAHNFIADGIVVHNSSLEPARWIWKRLMLLEDSAMMYRLQRAPERYAFYVDVGDMPPKEAMAHLHKVRQQYRKTKFYNPQCLTAETCVTLLDGTDKSMTELVRDYADKEFDVFSYDLESGKVVPGKASKPRLTHGNAPIWRVVLDNGAIVRCTGNHPFLMRDGQYRAANTLESGDSLMPLYMSRGSKGTHGYWMYQDQKTGKRRPVHKMVAEHTYGDLANEGLNVHHKDLNKANNTPDNLEYLTKSKEAQKLSSEHGKAVMAKLKASAAEGQAALLDIISSEVVRDSLVVAEELVDRLNEDLAFTEIYESLPTTKNSRLTTGCLFAFLKRQGFAGFKEFKQEKTGQASLANQTYGGEATSRLQPNNHKVVSVTFEGYEDVYNMDVEKYHNFALTGGVFVHNTGKLDLKFNPLPVSYDTSIPLLDGRTITIEEMSKEHAEGKKHWVYSIDRETKKPVPGEVSWVGKTRENAKALKITFDDGGHTVMAPDHPVMMRDCRYVNAEDLEVGDSVMPLYRRQTTLKRDGLVGYERMYNPAENRSRITHRMMAEAYYGEIPKGFNVHHVDFDRRNNCPSNLEILSTSDHVIKHHEADYHPIEVCVDGSDYVDPERDNRVKVNQSYWLVKYNKSEEKRKKTSELNRLYDTAQHIRAYNASEQHTVDNEIRRVGKKAFWQDEERAEKARKRMRIIFPDEFVEGLKALIRANPSIRAEGVVRSVNDEVSSLLTGLDEANRRSVKSVHRHMLLNLYRDLGHKDFADFKQSTLSTPLNNHKVVSIEEVESCDMYCMTVEKWHNFALLLKDDNGEIMNNSGIFAKNSQDEDFFLPVRKGVQGSKIDVLSGPNWQHMEDINYFRLKLFAAIKVPKAYLGYDESRGKSTGANDDVRFARTVLRTQRELRNGLKKIGRVHLAALGINPAAVDYEVYMTVPSSIFELAQLEVRNAKADFAGRMSQFVSLHWILQKIFGLSEDDIDFVLKERHKESLRDAEVQAKAMGMTLDVQNSAQTQAMQQQMQLQQGQQAVAGAVQAEPGTKQAEDAHLRLREFSKSSRLWSQIRQGRSFNPIGEQELFNGNREHEKRMEEQLGWMQENGVRQNRNMEELGGLLKELAHTRKS